MEIKNEFEDIRFEMEQLEFQQDAELRKRGWQQTSSTPGSLWLWRKEMKGYGVLLVNKSTAIHVSEWELHQ